MPSIVAVIPAKQFSRRLRDKNAREIGGRKLYEIAAHTCIGAGCFARIFLSSDGSVADALPAEVARKIFIHQRAVGIDGYAPDVPATEVAREVRADFYPGSHRPEWVCLVQPTSPCLRETSLRAAAQLCREDIDAVIAHGADKGRYPCGAFYFLRTHVLDSMSDLMSTLNVLDDTDRVAWFPLPTDEAIDVDCEADLHLARLILEDRNHADHS